MTRSARALLVALLLAPAPRALGEAWWPLQNEVASELWLLSGPVSPSARRTAQVGYALDAALDVGRGLTLDLGLGITWLQDPDTPLRRQTGLRSQAVLELSAAVLWEASEHLALGLAGGFSPRSRVIADSLIAYTDVSGAPATAEGIVVARSSSQSGEVVLSLDTAGYSDFETGVDLGLMARHYHTDQELAALQGPGGLPLTADELLQQLLGQCPGQGLGLGQGNSACKRQLLGLLRQQPGALTQLALRGSVAETLWLDTDVGLAGRWYGYDRDPTEVGFFRLAAAGGAGAEFGAGIPMAPLAWSIRPWLAHRFGGLLVRGWWEHGAYVQHLGWQDTFALRLQQRFGPAFRAWVAASVQREHDVEGGAATISSVAIGAMIRW